MKRIPATRYAAALLGCAIGLTALGVAAADVDSIVVRYRDPIVPAGAIAPPVAQLQALSQALQVAFTVANRTRDGAFRIEFAAPVDIDRARAALNRVRGHDDVLYANAFVDSVVEVSGPPTDRLIVKYRDPSRSSAALAGMPLDVTEGARLGALVGQALAPIRSTAGGEYVLQMLQRLPAKQVAAMAQALAQQPDVEFAEPDAIWTIQDSPTDPCYASAADASCVGGYQWDLFDSIGGIDMPPAWDRTTGSSAIRVAVIDTGVLYGHPDLSGRILPGYDMIADCAVANDGQPGPCTWSSQVPDAQSRDGDASDPGDWITSAESRGGLASPPYSWFQDCGASNSSWHGTHVAGTIGAVPNNGIGIAGINWVSGIVPVRVLGKCGGYTSDINDAIVWAAGGSVPGIPANPNPARVVNMSFGGTGSCPASTQRSITTALGLGAVLAVAAGNANSDASSFSPANCSGVITVAATIRNGARASYSNFGTTVEIAAPGGGSGSYILSTLNSGKTVANPTGYTYALYQGTSMATPHVAGVASLVLSVKPSLTPAQVLSTLQSTARPFPTGTGNDCTTSLCGAGILDAGAAVAAVSGVVISPTTTSLASSLNPSTVGTNVTFTATVTGSVPSGAVSFSDNGAAVAGCGAVALGGKGNVRTARCTTGSLAAGTHPIVATYSGDAANAGSSSAPLSQVVDGVAGNATTTTLTSSRNPAKAGARITFTATVSGGVAPKGTLAFSDNGVAISGCSAVPLSAGSRGSLPSAQCTTAGLAPGTHPITATYSGDASNAGSTSNVVNQIVR